MLKGPSRYNPRLHPERALNRRNTVIDQMMKYDYLDEETGEKIKQEELQLHYIPVNHFPVWLLIYAKKYAGMPTGSSKNTTKNTVRTTTYIRTVLS